ncbi:MAG: hypothetical protein OXP12_09595 [Thaumarchaeota archaeon]|nr:hypothetical protein [Nitrososphaerota archaeon]
MIKVRPYALRSYFDSQLLIAESHGCMTHAYRQFFMGHKGDMEARYTTNKGRLTEQMTEDMRLSYERSQTFLSTDVTHDSEANRRRMLVGMWRQQAKMYGLDPDAMIAGRILDGAQDAAVRRQAAVPATTAPETDQGSPDAEKKVAAVQDADATTDRSTQRQHPFESRIVDGEAELLAGAAEGRDLVRDLPGERFLIRRKIPKS